MFELLARSRRWARAAAFWVGTEGRRQGQDVLPRQRNKDHYVETSYRCCSNYPSSCTSWRGFRSAADTIIAVSNGIEGGHGDRHCIFPVFRSAAITSLCSAADTAIAVRMSTKGRVTPPVHWALGGQYTAASTILPRIVGITTQGCRVRREEN